MSDISIRRACADDLEPILELLRVSMKRDDDTRFEQLFRWKHLDNAFGPSPMWVACDGERIVGLRVFMRWEFDGKDGVKRAVRAVDTATHPDYMGRGIFTRLTMQALEDLRDEGVDFVYNTPNDQSRPGYLKMGWRVAGRAPTRIRPTRVSSVAALLGARTAASHWSEPTHAGVAVDRVLGDTDALAQLLASRRPSSQLRTHTTVGSLSWRYGHPMLGYRAVLASDDARDGVAIARLRRRGPSHEIAVVELIVPEGGSARQLARRLVRAFRPDADYALAVGDAPGFLPLPKLGPIVTTRSVASGAPASVAEFAFTLGDVELF